MPRQVHTADVDAPPLSPVRPTNVTSNVAQARRPIPRELAKILADCRDLTVHRLLLSFTALLDRVCDMLMDRAGKSDVRTEQQLFLEARQVLIADRAALMSEFEKRLRTQIEERVSGRANYPHL